MLPMVRKRWDVFTTCDGCQQKMRQLSDIRVFTKNILDIIKKL